MPGTTKSFTAILFQRKSLGCQFKGGTRINDPEGKAKDIRSRQWGYPWMIDVKSPADAEYVFNILRAAYEYEQ